MSLKRYRTETKCQNCDAEVKDKFCPNCGQENIQVQENFFHLIGEYISDSFQFDSKVLRSLVPLFTKPGFLTQEYWDGKRIRYIHPLRIFFYVTAVFALATTYFYEIQGEKIKDSMVHGDKALAKIDSSYLANLPDSARVLLPGTKKEYAASEVKEWKVRDARQVRKIKSGIDLILVNFKYVTFFLLPIYALIFKLFYRKRRKFYVDHVIYTIHLQTFVYCLISVLMLLLYFMPASLDLLKQGIFLPVAIYIAVSLHYLYQQKWWKTIVVSFLITVILFFITSLGIILPAFVDAIFLAK
ncbi:DUF3667 domain-containing protein [soil metagenome]